MNQGVLKPVALRDLSRINPEELALVPSPATGTPGALTPPREFNLMFQTNVGAMSVSVPNQPPRAPLDLFVLLVHGYKLYKYMYVIHLYDGSCSTCPK